MSEFSTLFFDLDQTIYPASSGIWEDVAGKIQAYLERELGLTPQEAIDRRVYYYQEYGTTLRGLQHETSVDPISYMHFIHDVPVELKIQPDSELPGLLQSINIPKYIFTNASIDHAMRILKHLAIEECFDDIIDIIRLEYANKPDPVAYKRALEIAGNPDPSTCILIDDSLMNLEAAAGFGMKTVHVGTNGNDHFTPDHQITSIHALFDVLPEIKNSSNTRKTLDG